MEHPPRATDSTPSREAILAAASNVLGRAAKSREDGLKKDLEEQEADCCANICVCFPLGGLALLVGGEELLRLLTCAGSSCLNITGMDLGFPIAGLGAGLGMLYCAHRSARNYFTKRDRRKKQAYQEAFDEALLRTFVRDRLRAEQRHVPNDDADTMNE